MITNSEFVIVREKIFNGLIKDKDKCLKTIDKNRKLIDAYLNGNIDNTLTFVNDLIDVVLNPKVKKYKLIETVLNDRLFVDVLAYFRQSEVLIRACKKVNKKAVKWLLTMNINLGVQDDQGMTALMHAVKEPELDFAVDHIIGTGGKHIHILDNNGNTALFYATENYETLKYFTKYKDLYNPNHINNNNENILIYACRHKQIKMNYNKYIALLEKYGCKDATLVNNEGKTAAMYLVEKLKFNEIKLFVKDYNLNPNYINNYGNSLLSVLVQKYYVFYTNRITEKEGFGLNLPTFKKYALTFIALREIGCDFSIPIDISGNDITVVLSKLKDYTTINYLFDKGTINFVVDNKQIPNSVYAEVNVNDPVVQKNIKTLEKWLRESYYPEGTIDLSVANNVGFAS